MTHTILIPQTISSHSGVSSLAHFRNTVLIYSRTGGRESRRAVLDKFKRDCMTCWIVRTFFQALCSCVSSQAVKVLTPEDDAN